MCNLSEVVLERGIERGIKVGEERGEARGIQIGETRGINALIEALNELGVSSDVIMSQLMLRFSLTEEQARKYLCEWKKETCEGRY